MGAAYIHISLGLLAYLPRFDGWGGCQGCLTTEPEDMGQDPYGIFHTWSVWGLVLRTSIL